MPSASRVADRPSMVRMAAPSAISATGSEQERTGSPSISTVQAPQTAMPQLYFVPVRFSTSRRTQSSGISPSTSTVTGLPLMFSAGMAGTPRMPHPSMTGRQNPQAAQSAPKDHGGNGMRAIELQAFAVDRLVMAERPQPEPKPGEVLVGVRACSLNYRDWLMVQGAYNPKQKLPLVPLSDGAGEVIAVGPGVSGFKPGDRVVPHFFPNWSSGEPSAERFSVSMGGPYDGWPCAQRTYPAHALARIPDHLDFAEAATLPCAALTAWSAIVTLGRVQPGDLVLVQGTGGVSLFALQFAKLAGAEVIVTSSSDEKLEKAKAL